ncbi:MAG: DUF167 family protein [Oligoflexia bacterium]|nr:DUF167 family protein [Oligoflexia bacterium]
MSWLEETPKGLVLHLYIQPKASRTQVQGLHGEPPRLRIRVAAPPVEGEANEELLRFLKKHTHIAGARFELLRGDSSKTKDVLCTGVTAEQLRAALAP